MAEEKKTKTTTKKTTTKPATKKPAAKKTTATKTTKKTTSTKKPSTQSTKKQTRPIEENKTSVVEKKVETKENDFVEASERTKNLAYALIFILLAVVVLLLAVE